MDIEYLFCLISTFIVLISVLQLLTELKTGEISGAEVHNQVLWLPYL